MYLLSPLPPFASHLFAHTSYKRQKNWLQVLVIHRGDEEYLVVDGVGIRPGDTFLFYHSDSDTASSSCLNAFENLKVLKAASSSKTRYSIRDAAAGGGGSNDEVFGGLMFSCHYRGESYFDSFPFYSNFPGAPLAGVVCNREIGRDSTGSSTSMWQQAKGESPARCSLHVCTTVFLVLSFVPPSADHWIIRQLRLVIMPVCNSSGVWLLFSVIVARFPGRWAKFWVF